MNPLLVATAMALEDLSNIELATANNAITGFGSVGKEACAYKPLLDAALIKENGYPCDNESLLQALSFEINRRLDAGTWN